MTQKEAEEKLMMAFGPFYRVTTDMYGVSQTVLCDEAVFSLYLIKGLKALGLLEIEED